MIRSGLVQYHDALQPLLVDIDTVHQHPRNYNNGDVDKIAESIEVNGMYRPIYAQRGTGTIIAGNHTWIACKQLGAETIPVVWLDIDDTTVSRILVADNWIASLALPDQGLLYDLLKDIDAEVTLIGTGVTDDDLARLQTAIERTSAAPVPETDGYRCPECGHEWRGNPRPTPSMSLVQET